MDIDEVLGAVFAYEQAADQKFVWKDVDEALVLGRGNLRALKSAWNLEGFAAK